ncbi:MAG: response regulator transcription factor [Candidatus Lindowbacteria bacterium]|nr:response regulator transcription factor [Candidatus Lindowbacteria bacterium]
MSPYRIVLADDHAILRQAVRRILEEDSNFEIVGDAEDGLQLLGLLKILPADMVILDISMPKLGGIESIAKIKAIQPNMKILILTMHGRREYLHEAIAAGAAGFSLKQDADKDLCTAIMTVRKGEIYVSPSLSKEAHKDWAEFLRGKKPAAEGDVSPLTQREKEILKFIADGKSNREVADILFISVRTVEWHRAQIMRKLGLRNTVELVKYAMSIRYG